MVRKLAWAGWASVALAMGYVVFLYVTGDPSDFTAQFRGKYLRHLAVVVFHGVLGVTALVLGPLQFYPGLHRDWPRLHRTLGLLYLTAVGLGGLSGLRMALMAEGGLVGRAGFTVLSLLWLGTGWLAWRTALARRFGQHRAWMIRNYALTFSAVTLRLQLTGWQEAGVPFDLLYPVMAWLSWLPNLALAELIFLRRRSHGSVPALPPTVRG